MVFVMQQIRRLIRMGPLSRCCSVAPTSRPSLDQTSNAADRTDVAYHRAPSSCQMQMPSRSLARPSAAAAISAAEGASDTADAVAVAQLPDQWQRYHEKWTARQAVQRKASRLSNSSSNDAGYSAV